MSYQIAPRPTGRYASQLEYQWGTLFERMGLKRWYTGDYTHTHDFVVWIDGRRLAVEIKPWTKDAEFVNPACLRGLSRNEKLIVIEGAPPGHCRWWFAGWSQAGPPLIVQIPLPWTIEATWSQLLARWEKRLAQADAVNGG